MRKVKRAFTLVELMVSLSIITILFVAFVQHTENSVFKAREASVRTDFRNYYNAIDDSLRSKANVMFANNNSELLVDFLNGALDDDMKFYKAENNDVATFRLATTLVNDSGEDVMYTSKKVDAWGSNYILLCNLATNKNEVTLKIISKSKDTLRSYDDIIMTISFLDGRIKITTEGFGASNVEEFIKSEVPLPDETPVEGEVDEKCKCCNRSEEDADIFIECTCNGFEDLKDCEECVDCIYCCPKDEATMRDLPRLTGGITSLSLLKDTNRMINTQYGDLGWTNLVQVVTGNTSNESSGANGTEFILGVTYDGDILTHNYSNSRLSNLSDIVQLAVANKGASSVIALDKYGNVFCTEPNCKANYWNNIKRITTSKDLHVGLTLNGNVVTEYCSSSKLHNKVVSGVVTSDDYQIWQEGVVYPRGSMVLRDMHFYVNRYTHLSNSSNAPTTATDKDWVYVDYIFAHLSNFQYIGDWHMGYSYGAGNKVKYKGNYYVALQSNVSYSEDWTPSRKAGFWAMVRGGTYSIASVPTVNWSNIKQIAVASIDSNTGSWGSNNTSPDAVGGDTYVQWYPKWSSNTNYSSGTVVLYGREMYVCIKTHKSQTTPNNDSTNWLYVDDYIAYWPATNYSMEWHDGWYYAVGNKLKHEGYIYVALINHLSNASNHPLTNTDYWAKISIDVNDSRNLSDENNIMINNVTTALNDSSEDIVILGLTNSGVMYSSDNRIPSQRGIQQISAGTNVASCLYTDGTITSLLDNYSYSISSWKDIVEIGTSLYGIHAVKSDGSILSTKYSSSVGSWSVFE